VREWHTAVVLQALAAQTVGVALGAVLAVGN